MTCPIDKKKLSIVTVFSIKYGFGCVLLDSNGKIQDYMTYLGFREDDGSKKVDEHYFGIVKNMVDKVKKKVGDYETDIVIINIVPEDECSKFEDPQSLDIDEYRKVREEMEYLYRSVSE
jgi:hypothetical protein